MAELAQARSSGLAVSRAGSGIGHIFAPSGLAVEDHVHQTSASMVKPDPGGTVAVREDWRAQPGLDLARALSEQFGRPFWRSGDSNPAQGGAGCGAAAQKR